MLGGENFCGLFLFVYILISIFGRASSKFSSIGINFVIVLTVVHYSITADCTIVSALSLVAVGIGMGLQSNLSRDWLRL